MSFGETLRLLRERHGWDQQTLAQHAGIDASVVSRLERGLQTDFKVSVLITLARTLTVSLDTLLDHPATPPSPLITELELVLPDLARLSPAHQRQVAAIVRSYLSTLPDHGAPDRSSHDGI